MSKITSTDPCSLNTLILPSVESPTLTWLGVGGLPATQFRFDAFGNDASAGNTVRKLVAVPLTVVRLETIPVAVVGIVQLPFVPHTAKVASSSAPIGVERLPTVFAARVSNNRHGTIGTTEETSPGAAVKWPDRPTTVAVAAARAAAIPRCSETKRAHRPSFGLD